MDDIISLNSCGYPCSRPCPGQRCWHFTRGVSVGEYCRSSLARAVVLPVVRRSGNTGILCLSLLHMGIKVIFSAVSCICSHCDAKEAKPILNSPLTEFPN